MKNISTTSLLVEVHGERNVKLFFDFHDRPDMT